MTSGSLSTAIFISRHRVASQGGPWSRPGSLSWGRSHLEPGGQKGVLAGPAAHIQNSASEGTRLSQLEESRLGASDFPTRGARIQGLEVLGPPYSRRTRKRVGAFCLTDAPVLPRRSS